MKTPVLISFLWRDVNGGNAPDGEVYGVPGKGRSFAISVVTVFALIFLWWAVTRWGVVDPLFLPSPSAVWNRAMEVATIGFGGSSLWGHAWMSIYRVFLAFFFACLHRDTDWFGHGYEPDFQGTVRSAHRLLPADTTAGLSAADHHLVRNRRNLEDHPHLPRLFRTDGLEYQGRCPFGIHRTDPRGLLPRCDPGPR